MAVAMQVRRKADPAKNLVKSWIQNWKDVSDVQQETSHKELSGINLHQPSNIKNCDAYPVPAHCSKMCLSGITMRQRHACRDFTTSLSAEQCSKDKMPNYKAL